MRARGVRIERGGRPVVDGLDLTVPAGRVVGLLGPSGSGKTTLMRAVVGVQAHVAGDLRVLGRPAGSADLRHRIGYMTQAASVYTDLSVVENLRYAAAIQGAGRDDVARVLDEVDLTGHARQLVATLSGGERSRVSLAMALLGVPDLLVLDEPTVGLDPVLRRSLWDLFARLRDAGRSLLVSSHVMDEASRCDLLVLLRDGDVLAQGTLDELRARTGAPDAEGVFLALVDAADAAGAA